MSEIFLPDTAYSKLVAVLLKVATNPGYDPENEIKTALGEAGDIWPASIRAERSGAAQARLSIVR